MQGAGDVGRWNQYAITVATVAGFEKFCFFPVLVKALLNGLRIEVIVHGDSDNARWKRRLLIPVFQCMVMQWITPLTVKFVVLAPQRLTRIDDDFGNSVEATKKAGNIAAQVNQ